MERLTEEQIEEKIAMTKGVIALLPDLWGKDTEFLQARMDYWESRLLTLEEQLYNRRNGDV